MPALAFPIDPQTSAFILMIVATVIGFVKSDIPGGPSRVRMAAAGLASLLYAVWTGTHTAYHGHPAVLANAVMTAAGQGLLDGAALTLSIAGAALAQDKLTTVRAKLAAQPGVSVADATAPTS